VARRALEQEQLADGRLCADRRDGSDARSPSSPANANRATEPALVLVGEELVLMPAVAGAACAANDLLSGGRDTGAAFAEPVALAFERDHGGVVDEPVDQGGCGGGDQCVGEDL